MVRRNQKPTTNPVAHLVVVCACFLLIRLQDLRSAAVLSLLVVMCHAIIHNIILPAFSRVIACALGDLLINGEQNGLLPSAGNLLAHAPYCLPSSKKRQLHPTTHMPTFGPIQNKKRAALTQSSPRKDRKLRTICKRHHASLRRAQICSHQDLSSTDPIAAKQRLKHPSICTVKAQQVGQGRLDFS